MLPSIYVKRQVILPDKGEWQFRIEIQSETSDNIYVIAQHKTKKYWGCSCPGWRSHRTCKHLHALGLPVKEIPFEVNVIPT